MNYRKGVPDDLTGICALVEAAKKEMQEKGIDQWDVVYPVKEDFARDIENSTLYVVEKEQDFVGVFVLSREADEAYFKCEWEGMEDTACILHRLCLSPKYQGKGLSREIMSYVEALAKSLGYQSIRLDAFTKNPIAIRLYAGSGYKERGFADWRKGRFVLMEKAL